MFIEQASQIGRMVINHQSSSNPAWANDEKWGCLIDKIQASLKIAEDNAAWTIN